MSVTIPQNLANFNINDSTVEVWLYRKYARPDGSIRFSSHWISTDEALDNALKSAIIENRDTILEVVPYSLLSTAYDGVTLHISVLETHAWLLIAEAVNPVPSRKVTRLKDIQNSPFYLIKLVHNEQILYAARKTDNSWKSKKAANLLSVFYADAQLGLCESPEFTISKNIDFFIIDNDIIILDKLSFESILSHKAAHAEDFLALQSETEFQSLFQDIEHIIGFINTNKLQLRRACAIRQKGHYKNINFMKNLRLKHQQCGLNIQFNNSGQIVATPDTCPDIIRALLDHRLSSYFSEKNYDVPDATAIP